MVGSCARLGHSELPPRHVTIKDSDRSWVLFGLMPTNGSTQASPSKTRVLPSLLLGPYFPSITEASNAYLSLVFLFLGWWEDIISLQLGGDEWLILANRLWVEITHHFMAGTPNCQYKTPQGFLSWLQWTISIDKMVRNNSEKLIFTVTTPDV